MEKVKYPIVTQCFLHKEKNPSADDYCNLAQNTLSCGLYVNLVDFMKIFFCDLKLSSIPLYGLLNAIMLIGWFSLLHMMTKYFFLPNLVTLIEFIPTTRFGASYLISGPSILMPYYTTAWARCSINKENLSPLEFAKLVGDILRHFVMGFMMQGLQGYKVEGVTLWSSVKFVELGVIYLLIVTNRNYNIRLEGRTKDLNLLELRVLAFFIFFIIVLIVVLAASYTTFARSGLKEKPVEDNFSGLDSDDEVLGSFPKQRFYSRKTIWWRSVNGNKIMSDSPMAYRLFMIPFFFVLAHFIPVITTDRFLLGWVKYINCLCLLALPVLLLFYQYSAVDFVIAAFLCWASAFLVFISTHSLRRPDRIWLYSLLGLTMSSMAICVLNREIENLVWQFISLRYDILPDLNALMYFGLGDMFSQVIVVKGMQRRKMGEACFGFVMSTTTYGLFLAFPLLYYHNCYHPKCMLIATASSETCLLFLLIILSTSVLHVSMSGYEFRYSLFFYLLGQVSVYLIFQWMRHHEAVFPLTFLPKLLLK